MVAVRGKVHHSEAAGALVVCTADEMKAKTYVKTHYSTYLAFRISPRGRERERALSLAVQTESLIHPFKAGSSYYFTTTLCFPLPQYHSKVKKVALPKNK